MSYSTLLLMSSIALSGCLIKSLLWRESSKETYPKHIVSSSPFPNTSLLPAPNPTSHPIQPLP